MGTKHLFNQLETERIFYINLLSRDRELVYPDIWHRMEAFMEANAGKGGIRK
jgi:hypothetical protein